MVSLIDSYQFFSSQLDSGGIMHVVAAVSAHPNLTGLPGSNVLQQLVDGAEAWALAIALLGAFVGAAIWAVASHTHNHQYAARGRMAALISGASALVVGAAPGLVNFFERLGTTAR
jgi:Mn2+/Fe2+ NRAMP family transporter